MLQNALVLRRDYNPNGTRAFSSNYDPFTMWASGELLLVRRRIHREIIVYVVICCTTP